MNRPYIICHMTTSMNGKVTGKFLESKEGLKAAEYYDQIHREYEADGFICGRVTMEKSFTGGWYPDLTKFLGQKIPREDYIVTYDAKYYAVAFDTYGKLGWKESEICDEDPGYDKAHIIEILSEDAEDAYLAYLRSIGVSYIFAGKKEIDVGQAVYKLWHHCIGNCFLLEGGGILNSSFKKAGVIDELSLVQVPVLAEADDKPLFYEGMVSDYELITTEKKEDIVWQKYSTNRKEAKHLLKLSVIIEAMECVSENVQYYYDLNKHEYMFISEYDGFEDETEECLEQELERFIRLPSQYEIPEYDIMEEFIESLPDSEEKNQLFQAMRGRGVFHKFKNLVNDMQMAQQWYDYRSKAYREIAICWCLDHEYEYEEDEKPIVMN